MGAGAGGYVQITLQTLLSKFASGTLHRMSRLSFTGAPVPDADHAPPNLPAPSTPAPSPGSPPAAKLGLGGLDASKVALRLFAQLNDQSLADMGATPDPAITKELQAAFGGNWAGYSVAVAPTGGRFQLVADVSVTDAFQGTAADKPFRVIPVVIAFGTDQFAKHYLLSVIVAQQTEEKVDTAVIQPYA